MTVPILAFFGTERFRMTKRGRNNLPCGSNARSAAPSNERIKSKDFKIKTQLHEWRDVY